MAILRRFFPFKSLAVIVGLFLAWQAYVFIAPKPRDYSELELTAASEVCSMVSNHLETYASEKEGPGDANGNLRAGVVHFINDPDDTITDLFKGCLSKTPGLQIDDTSVIQRFLADVGGAIKDSTSLDEVINAGRRVELDLIVGGRVIAIEDTENAGRAVIEVYAYDLEEGGWIMKKEFIAHSKLSASAALSGTILKMHPLWRLLIWLAIVGLLPWLAAPLTHKAVESKSNLASAALLGFYILAGALLALCLSGFEIAGIWDGIKLTVAIVFCAVYSYIVSERIAAG